MSIKREKKRAHKILSNEEKGRLKADAATGQFSTLQLSNRYKVAQSTVNSIVTGRQGVKDRNEQFGLFAKVVGIANDQVDRLDKGESLTPAPAPLEQKPFTWMLNALIEDGATYKSVSAAGNCPKGTLETRVQSWLKRGDPAEVETWSGLRKLVTNKEHSNRMLRMTMDRFQKRSARGLPVPTVVAEYTADEMVKMEQLWHEGKTHTRIASILGRSMKSVANKFARMGLARKGEMMTNGNNDKQQALEFPAPASQAPATPAPALSPWPSMLEELEAQKAQLAAKAAADMADIDAKIEAKKQAMARVQLRPTIIDRLATYIREAKDDAYCVFNESKAVGVLKLADELMAKRENKNDLLWITTARAECVLHNDADIRQRDEAKYQEGYKEGKEAALAELASTVTPAPIEPMMTAKEAKRLAQDEYRRGLDYGKLTAHPLYGMNPITRQIYEAQLQAFIDKHIKSASGAQADQLRFGLLAERAGISWNRNSFSNAVAKESLGLFPGYETDNFFHGIPRAGAEGFMIIGPVKKPTNPLDGAMTLTDKGRRRAECLLANPLRQTMSDKDVEEWWAEREKKDKGGSK